MSPTYFLSSPSASLAPQQTPEGVCDFLNLAISTLNDTGSSTKKITKKDLSGNVINLGSLFVKAIKQIAIPTEIEAMESRYGKSLESFSKQKTVTPIDILAFSSSLLDQNLETIQLLEEGGSAPADSFAKKVFEHYSRKLDSRTQLAGLVSGIDLSRHKTSLSQNPKLYRDLVRLSLDSKVMTEEQFYEILTKKIANGYLSEGMTIPLPHFYNEQTGQQDAKSGVFVVKKVIKCKGLMAFALVPFDASPDVKPTILFRPTTEDLSHENSLETFADDLGEHIGKRSFEPAKTELLNLLNDPEFIPSGEKATVCGFSLGGAHAARLLAACPDKFSKAVFFNDPSTEEAVAQEFVANLANSTHTAESLLDIQIYHTEKDIVIHAGDYHVGYIGSTYVGAELAREKCRVLVQKIRTSNTETDSEAVPTPSLLSLASRVHRAAFSRKFVHHTEIVFSAIESPAVTDDETIDPRPRISSLSSIDSTQDPGTPSSPRTPRSPSLRQVEVLDMSYLNRNNDPEVRRFNDYRMQMTALRVLSIKILEICTFIGNLIKVMIANPSRRLYNYFMVDALRHRKEFIDNIERTYGRFQADLQEFLSVPPAGNYQAARLAS